jgi:hypothetical protein
MPSNAQLKTALVVVATIIAITAIQRHVAPIPVIGEYLPH